MTPRISLGQTNPFVGTREEVTRLVRRCPRTQTCRLGRSAASSGSSAGAQRARTKPLRPLPPNPDLGSALDKPSAKSHGALRPPTARRLSRGGVCLWGGMRWVRERQAVRPSLPDSGTPPAAPPSRLRRRPQPFPPFPLPVAQNLRQPQPVQPLPNTGSYLFFLRAELRCFPSCTHRHDVSSVLRH